MFLLSTPHSRTVYGSCQAPFSVRPVHYYQPVDSKSKKKRGSHAPIVATLARNIEAALAWARASKPLEDWSDEGLAAKAKIGKGTAARMRRGDNGAGCDTLEAVAAVFGFRAWQMLTDSFDPTDPPEIANKSVVEQRVADMHGAFERLLARGNKDGEPQRVPVSGGPPHSSPASRQPKAARRRKSKT